ncbi:type II toxin-antitoxin system RelE/ParE family toxin [Acidisarcina polymorpha]|uniref:type II toxin-antitoxin system RelE/ParE family toxin n=1 Tax=Acidisarcina polymorpha TaxID=2211140 RepID=UPI000DEEB225
MAVSAKTRQAVISWEGDSREILRTWPKPIREDFGVALGEMQEGNTAALPVRPMPSIAAGVFELKDSDEGKWYRLIYLARVKDTIYVLHCFTKNTSKTEKRDLATAEQRWKQVQQRLREEQSNEKQKQQRGKIPPPDARKRAR